jgi:hypothetical protein
MNYIQKQNFKNIQSEYYRKLLLKKSIFDSFHTCSNLYDANIHINSFGFLFTVQFKPINSKSVIQKQKIIKKEIEIIHDNISQIIIENKAARNKKFRPFMVSFYDVECSRTHKYNFTHELPHVHGVLLVHPKTAPNFEKIYEIRDLIKTQTNYVDRIVFRRIDNGCEGIKNIVDYGLKYASNVFDSNFNYELDYVFPEPDGKNYPFYGYLDKIQV